MRFPFTHPEGPCHDDHDHPHPFAMFPERSIDSIHVMFPRSFSGQPSDRTGV